MRDFIPPILMRIYNRITENPVARKNRLARHNFVHSFFKSYAGFEHEDLLVDYLLNFKNKGYYVEVGVADPIEAVSITRRFYERGWDGVNIEPCLKEFSEIQKYRPRGINLNICIGKESGKMPFYELEGNQVGSTLSFEQANISKGKISKREVDVLSLKDLHLKYNLPEVDFIVIDVEGYEMNVLEGNDWEKFRPTVIIIETVQKNYLEIIEFLERGGYMIVYNNYLNSIFVDKKKFANDTRFDISNVREARQK